MVGIVVNRYNGARREAEIIEVEVEPDGRRHLVAAREFHGGKRWLNTFTRDKHIQSVEMINRENVASVTSPSAT